MSLLTACQNVVKETGIGTVPATIISNTDATAVQLNALAERAAKKLAKRDWEKMLREHTITTVASTETYALPADWARYISDTAWDASNFWQMRGQINPQLWQALKRGLVSVSVRKRFRLRGGLVYINPIPSAVETLVIEYARNTPWTDSTGITYRVAATADTDITVFPENLLELDLKWRWKNAKGLDYTEDYNEAEREISLAFAQDSPAQTLDFGCVADYTPPYPNVPVTV